MCEFEDVIPAREILDWQEFELMEPFGSFFDNWRTAMLAQIFAAAFSSRGHAPAFSSFMWKDPRQQQVDEDELMVAWFDAKVKN